MGEAEVSQRLITRDGREVVEEIVERVAGGEVVDERLNEDPRPGEDRLAAHHAGGAGDEGGAGSEGGGHGTAFVSQRWTHSSVWGIGWVERVLEGGERKPPPQLDATPSIRAAPPSPPPTRQPARPVRPRPSYTAAGHAVAMVPVWAVGWGRVRGGEG